MDGAMTEALKAIVTILAADGSVDWGILMVAKREAAFRETPIGEAYPHSAKEFLRCARRFVEAGMLEDKTVKDPGWIMFRSLMDLQTIKVIVIEETRVEVQPWIVIRMVAEFFTWENLPRRARSRDELVDAIAKGWLYWRLRPRGVLDYVAVAERYAELFCGGGKRNASESWGLCERGEDGWVLQCIPQFLPVKFKLDPDPRNHFGMNTTGRVTTGFGEKERAQIAFLLADE